MEEASIILLGLSQTYLNSDRCAVEWKLAASLAERKQATVIMGAVKPCSRPDPLKKLNLMYLDFVDHKKESVVWKVLVDTIGENSVLLSAPVILIAGVECFVYLLCVCLPVYCCLANLKNQINESKEHDSYKKQKQKEIKPEPETVITFATKKPYQRDPLGIDICVCPWFH